MCIACDGIRDTGSMYAYTCVGSLQVYILVHAILCSKVYVNIVYIGLPVSCLHLTQYSLKYKIVLVGYGTCLSVCGVLI